MQCDEVPGGTLRVACLFRRSWPVALAAAAGLGLSLTAFFLTREAARRETLAAFRRTASDRSSAVQEGVRDLSYSLESAGAFLIGSSQVQRSQFATFVRPLIPFVGGLRGLVWIPHVTLAERVAYESAARREGLKDYQITERGPEGRLVRAATRPEYFPIYYAEPRGGNEVVLGFDEASDATRRKAMERARDTGEVVATEAIRLIVAGTHTLGTVAFQPVYRSGAPADSRRQRRGNLLGLVAVAFQFSALVEDNLKPLQPAGVDIALFAEQPGRGRGLLYFHASRTRNAQQVVQAPLEAAEGGDFITNSRVELGGQRWLIQCTAAPAFFARHTTASPRLELYMAASCSVIRTYREAESGSTAEEPS